MVADVRLRLLGLRQELLALRSERAMILSRLLAFDTAQLDSVGDGMGLKTDSNSFEASNLVRRQKALEVRIGVLLTEIEAFESEFAP
ncbi:MAG: hypothetical protein Q7R47_02785 [Candidatus Diapherotrites archaeon]|nr:hypothetical protein [Candidatus Diapherotrites archaeon]